MKKKILGILLVAFVFFSGIFNVNALTKSEFNIIKNDVLRMVNSLVDPISFFDEGELPELEEIISYSCFNFDYNYYDPNNISEYIVDWVEPEDYYGPKYKVPAEKFEKFISDSFAVDEIFFVDFRENFKVQGDIFGITEAEYVIEEDGKYYYTYTLQTGIGTADDFFYDFRGYKDLGNSNYQLYYYLAYNEDDLLALIPDYPLPENPVEGIDYIMRNNYAEEPTKYIIIEEYTSKIFFNGEKTRLLSYLSVAKEDIPSADELLLPTEEEKVENKFLEGANQKFDANKDKKLVFRIDVDFSLFDKVYINGKELDSKNYTAKSGSTVITFTEEYARSLKNGNYDLKVTFTDGSSAETTFSVVTSVSNTQTGLYTSIGIIAVLGIIGCSIAFMSSRKHSKFPQA